MVHVYSPTGLNDLLQLYKKIPDSTLYGGGTGLLRNQSQKFLKLSENIIYLKKVPELSHISRTERFLEIGSCVTINRILSIGDHVIPGALFSALQSIRPLAIRNLATIGGNIYLRKNTYPVLLLMNTRIEIRSRNTSRWIQLNNLFSNNGKIELFPGEIITRIRIPFDTGNIQFYKIINQLCFCSLVKAQKDILNNINFIFYIFDKNYYRSREIEAEVSGRKLPLSNKDIDYITGLFTSFINEHEMSNFQKTYISNLLTAHLKNILKCT